MADSNSVSPKIWVFHRYVDFKYLDSEFSDSLQFFVVAFFIYSVIIYNSSSNNSLFLFFWCFRHGKWCFLFLLYFFFGFFVFLYTHHGYLVAAFGLFAQCSVSYGRRNAFLCLIRWWFTCAGFSLFYKFSVFWFLFCWWDLPWEIPALIFWSCSLGWLHFRWIFPSLLFCVHNEWFIFLTCFPC